MSYNSVLRPDLFAGQNILVTGGGSGIGRCIAHELCSLGARVLLLGRTLEKLQLVRAEISSAICFLLSDGARYITGQVIAIDGGSSLKTNSPLWPLKSAQNNESYDGFHRSELPKILQ